MAITFTRKEMTNKLGAVFPEAQTEVLVDIFDNIRQAELQRVADTYDLKKGLSDLTTQVNKLAVAQQHTDEHLAVFEQRTDERFAQLAEAQQRTDERLAAFEQRTDERFAKTDEHLTRLAEAQTKTDQALYRLEQVVEKGFTELRKEVGRLNNRFGFDLEEFVAALLPPYLERHQKIAHLTLQREYFQLPDGQEEEVDLVGAGERDAQPVTVLVEWRTSLKGGEARKLIRKLKKIQATISDQETLLVLVAMNLHPTATKAGAEEGALMVPYSHINRPCDFE